MQERVCCCSSEVGPQIIRGDPECTCASAEENSHGRALHKGIKQTPQNTFTYTKNTAFRSEIQKLDDLKSVSILLNHHQIFIYLTIPVIVIAQACIC